MEKAVERAMERFVWPQLVALEQSLAELSEKLDEKFEQIGLQNTSAEAEAKHLLPSEPEREFHSGSQQWVEGKMVSIDLASEIEAHGMLNTLQFTSPW